MKLSDLIDFNPKRPLEKGALTPFIEMADLPEGERDVSGIGSRVFNGGGSKFKNGDTLFARITPCLENGKTAKVSGLPSNAVSHGSTEFIVMAAKDPSIDEDFVYYVARHPDFRAYAKGRMEGTSGRQRVSWQAIADYDIPDFSSLERSGIGSVLSSMDNLISNNRRVTQALEAMARTLFKAWFVDFEPVRAKLEGRWQRGQSLPGLPAHLYDVFPDRLVESELGEIPEGWQMRSLDSIASYLNGLALQKFPPESETEFLPVIKIAQLRAGNTTGADKASTQIKSEYVVVDGDVLFSWSGSLEVEVWNGGRGALNQHLFKVTSNEVPKWFYFFATRQHLSDFRAIAAGKATTMGHIQRKHLTEARIAVAPPESMKKFDAVIASQFDQLVSSAQQSRALAQLRDTLLPKLVSGELRVPDVERIVGAAV
ncbi:restriction endonuclease subunit S [Aquaspirillum sp. LM1]|uniref:restriction endonuclease subunit S n=1 Tax=Aquaspirillum sp. LM1 TaxID=1938604 RepID=UPI000983F587|nr:restriction endonuclease subunit S [Aquaspirillum sp. LM1]AQR65766.1 restriction endonuclease subunit S [Aquaspirillum sp. LM1]